MTQNIDHLVVSFFRLAGSRYRDSFRASVLGHDCYIDGENWIPMTVTGRSKTNISHIHPTIQNRMVRTYLCEFEGAGGDTFILHPQEIFIYISPRRTVFASDVSIEEAENAAREFDIEATRPRTILEIVENSFILESNLEELLSLYNAGVTIPPQTLNGEFWVDDLRGYLNLLGLYPEEWEEKKKELTKISGRYPFLKGRSAICRVSGDYQSYIIP